MRWRKAPTGDTRKEGRKRGEYVVTEAKRVKSFTNEGRNQLLSMAERPEKPWKGPLIR